MLGRKSVVSTLIVLLGSWSSAHAADCVLNITRTACPGQEQESFSKCNGKANCTETKPAADPAACAAAATAACANSRKTITQNKVVTAQFNGSAVEGGKNFCAGHPDYPYAAKPDCK